MPAERAVRASRDAVTAVATSPKITLVDVRNYTLPGQPGSTGRVADSAQP
jgi:hypothetical protein